MLIRVSARASGPPGQACGPRPKARCSLALGRSIRNRSGSSKRRGSRPAAPLSTMTVEPAGMSTPPTVAPVRASRKSPFTGLSIAQALLDEVRDVAAVLPEASLDVGVVPDGLQRGCRAA